MWIRKAPNNYIDLSSHYDNLIFLWKSDSSPIYVMDNHLAAAWCWMQECDKTARYNFIHIDKHSDLAGKGEFKIIEHLRSKQNITIDEYTQLSYDVGLGNPIPSFQWDNYIRACLKLFPNWFNTNLFYTHDDNTHIEHWGYPVLKYQERDPSFVRYAIKQFIEERASFLGASFPDEEMENRPWIINLDLDFFWDFEGVKVFDDEFIRDFAACLQNAISNIQVMTIALSPECIRGWDRKRGWTDVLKVMEIFKEEIPDLHDFELPLYTYKQNNKE